MSIRRGSGFIVGSGTQTPDNQETPLEPLTVIRDVDAASTSKAAYAHGEEEQGDGPDDAEDEAESWYQWSQDKPIAPNMAESVQKLRQSLSVHGLHELTNMPAVQLRRSLGSKIWRSEDEVAKVPDDWERLIVHVIRAGIRSFNLAFIMRGSVMLVLALRAKGAFSKAKRKALLMTVFGATNLRFGLLFAVWSMLYKAAHNALRLTSPMPARYLSTHKRTSTGNLGSKSHSRHPSQLDLGLISGATTPRGRWLESESKEGEELAEAKNKQKRRAFMRDPRSKVWHAYLAGAISGLAILVEQKKDRISYAQQLFVRGLEGTYNSAQAKGLINIPNGAVLAFGFACGQIMYAWLNAPDTLPRGYISWITQASHISPGALPIHRKIMAGQQVAIDDTVLPKYFGSDKIPLPALNTDGSESFPRIAPNKTNRKGMIGSQVKRLLEIVEGQRQGVLLKHVPCEVVHPWQPNHLLSAIDRFIEVTRWVLPVYAILHFVPAIFLRLRSFRKDPIRVFVRSMLGALRSSSFLGMFVIIFQSLFCAFHSLYDTISKNALSSAVVPQWIMNFLVSPSIQWFAGFATCLSLFLEHKRRRVELAMYVLPKGMESAWSVARQRKWLPLVPGGEILLTTAGMSLVMGTYAQNPEHLSGIVRRIVYQFVGHN